MPQSLSKIYIHLIFGTKDREGMIEDVVRKELHSYMATILQNWETPVLTIGSVTDHVHILCMLSKNHHRHESFQDEYRRFLNAYNVDFDERYVWD